MRTKESIVDAAGVLASYAATLEVDRLPDGVLAHTRQVLADTVGVLLAASTQRSVRTAVRALSPDGGTAIVVGHGRGARPEVAAFINGIGGHDIELDDSHSPSRTHPAAVIVPAALAAAEVTPEGTIGDLLAGVIAGYEVQSRVSKAIGRNEQYARGFHPSAVVGAIGAAVAAGRVLRLPVEQLRVCLALAAGQAAGLLCYHDDPSHMAKSFQTGVAARNGVTAALFARAGYQAAPDVLTGRHTMLHPFGGDAADPSQLLDQLGTDYQIQQTSLKLHACCGLTHSAVDALLLMMRDGRFGFGDIERIDVELPHGSASVLDGNTLWTHNIQYVLALAAHEGWVGREHFAGEWTEHAAIRELAARVGVRGSDSLQENFPEFKSAIVAVTAGGSVHVLERDAPRGSPAHPLTDDEVRDKFDHLAGEVLRPDAVAQLWRVLVETEPGHPAALVFDQLATGVAQSQLMRG
jgi:2-methylcitrate dehydratase PrpD